MNCIVIVMRRDGSIEFLNNYGLELTGYFFEEIKDKKVWDVFIPSEIKDEIRKVFHKLVAGNFPDTNTNKWVFKNGKECNIEWSTTCTTDADGNISSMTSTGKDLSELEKALEEVRFQKMSITEINHRHSNYLQILQSLLSLKKINLENQEVKSVLDSIEASFESVSTLNSFFSTSSYNNEVDLVTYQKDLVEKINNLFNNDRINAYFESNISKFYTSYKNGLTIGLITNELLINTKKHCNKSNIQARLFLYKGNDDAIDLVYFDNGDYYFSDNEKKSLHILGALAQNFDQNTIIKSYEKLKAELSSELKESIEGNLEQVDMENLTVFHLTFK